MMRQFGFEVECPSNGKYIVKNSKTCKISSYTVETDATAASYPIALAAATSGAVLVKNFPREGLQGDVGFAQVMQKAGLVKCRRVENDLLALKSEPSAEACEFNFNDISDTFLTLAAIAPLFGRTTKITGIAHTRKQESDRVEAMAREISKFAKKVEFDEDSITIFPYEKSELAKKISSPVKSKPTKTIELPCRTALRDAPIFLAAERRGLKYATRNARQKHGPTFSKSSNSQERTA